jgi:phosphatidylethanolamine-binding protein (PEBP) family uncharacterized protein
MSPATRLSVLLAIPAATMAIQTSASAFTASFSWAGIPACQTVSPAFTLRDVPPGTKQLRFIMHDEQAPSFDHGGSTVPYRGSHEVPKGAIRYIGPCPPKGERHVYHWNIQAMNGNGNVLGQTSASASFPP